MADGPRSRSGGCGARPHGPAAGGSARSAPGSRGRAGATAGRGGTRLGGRCAGRPRGGRAAGRAAPRAGSARGAPGRGAGPPAPAARGRRWRAPRGPAARGRSRARLRARRRPGSAAGSGRLAAGGPPAVRVPLWSRRKPLAAPERLGAARQAPGRVRRAVPGSGRQQHDPAPGDLGDHLALAPHPRRLSTSAAAFSAAPCRRAQLRSSATPRGGSAPPSTSRCGCRLPSGAGADCAAGGRPPPAGARPRPRPRPAGPRAGGRLAQPSPHVPPALPSARLAGPPARNTIPTTAPSQPPSSAARTTPRHCHPAVPRTPGCAPSPTVWPASAQSSRSPA